MNAQLEITRLAALLRVCLDILKGQFSDWTTACVKINTLVRGVSAIVPDTSMSGVEDCLSEHLSVADYTADDIMRGLNAISTHWEALKRMLATLSSIDTWEKMSETLQEDQHWLFAKLSTASSHRELLALLNSVGPLNEIRRQLSLPSTTAGKAISFIGDASLAVRGCSVLNEDSKATLLNRFDRAVGERWWVARYTLRHWKTSEEWQISSVESVIREIKAYNDHLEHQGLPTIHVDDAIGTLVDYFHREGKHSNYPNELLTTMSEPAYWRSFRKEDSISEFLYWVFLATPSITLSEQILGTGPKSEESFRSAQVKWSLKNRDEVMTVRNGDQSKRKHKAPNATTKKRRSSSSSRTTASSSSSSSSSAAVSSSSSSS